MQNETLKELMPSDEIMNLKEEFKNWPKYELLKNYGTVNIDVCAIMFYLDRQEQEKKYG